MKTFKSLTYLLAITAFAGCLQHHNQQAANDQRSTKTDTLSIVPVTRYHADSTGAYALTVAFPVGSVKDPLANAIREWISEELGGTYGDSLTGDYTQLLADTAAVVDHYFAKTVKANSDEYAEMMLYSPAAKELAISFLDSAVVNKVAESADWVTFQEMRDVYTGGAHGGHTISGQTFRKHDGRRIGWDIITNTYEDDFQSLLKAGLMEYWDLKKEADLEDWLMGPANIYYIPLPQCQPLFNADGICFVYNQYEIAAYAAGLPNFTVPYDKLRPFLNATAHRLIDVEGAVR